MSHLGKLLTLASKLQSENQVLFCFFFPNGEKREGRRGLGGVPGFLTRQSQGALFKWDGNERLRYYQDLHPKWRHDSDRSPKSTFTQ